MYCSVIKINNNHWQIAVIQNNKITFQDVLLFYNNQLNCDNGITLICQ